ncbi:archaemetzincin-1 isoform X3 [Rhinolophus sinicus]|uniref:archaemetzincin-1 isoform X3 n=1 Tax=Rhinolophus sinicus TaxID=89399 RepID=UPI003D7BC3F6
MPVPSPGSSDDLSRGVICLYLPHLISFKISGSNPVLPQVFLGASGAPHPPCRESAEVRVCEPCAGPRSSSQCARQGPCGETGRRGVAPSPAWWPHTCLPVAPRSLPLRADVTPGPPRFSWPTPSVHAVLGPCCLCGLMGLREGILDFLKNSKPGDALCMLGLTLSDLYPCEAWSFTFGTFLPGHEVGICSFARFSGELLKVRPSALDPARAQVVADDPETTLRDEGRTLCFSTLAMVQCCKVTCHELCHLLGLGSCRWLRCLMQGVLSLDEALRRPLDLCPICLRKLQHILGFKLVERYKRLHTWTQAVAGMLPGQQAGEPSVSEDSPPCSADSGLCCDSDSEPGTSMSEPLTPDAWTHTFSAELEPQDGLDSLTASEAIAEHSRWLATCIQALEREVTEEELARVDRAVDALARWEMFTGRLPAVRRDRACGTHGAGLRKVLGDKLSSLRKRLSTRQLSRADASPCRWKAEDN